MCSLSKPLPVGSFTSYAILPGEGGPHFCTNTQNRPYCMGLRLVNTTDPDRPPRLSVINFDTPVIKTTIEGYRDYGTARWMAPEVGKSQGSKMKLAPTAAHVGGCSTSSTKGFPARDRTRAIGDSARDCQARTRSEGRRRTIFWTLIVSPNRMAQSGALHRRR